MKIIIRILVYLFLIIGLILLGIFVIKVFSDQKIHLLGTLDLEYAKTLGESAQVLYISWSILGILLIVMTLNIQREQFQDNKNFIRKQQFETTFFNMLNVLHNIKQAIRKDIVVGEVTINHNGQELIDYLKEDLNKRYQLISAGYDPESQIGVILAKVSQNKKIEKLEQDILRDELNTIYSKFYSTYHAELGHYFRYLYNLVNFTIVNRSEFKDEDSYINLIQAQLSNNELALLFYNVLSDFSLNKDKIPMFYQILEKYNFFENIDQNALIDRNHHVLYPATTFKFLNRDERQLRINP